MKERPIIFSTEMVKAILNGRKTQTRRVVKPQPQKDETIGNISCNGVVECWFLCDSDGDEMPNSEIRCPHGQVGDRLWVRETYGLLTNDKLTYRASCDEWHVKNKFTCKWKPSIFMPRCASRILLEIIGVRVERINCMTENEAHAEGVDNLVTFKELWDSLNSKRGFGWDINPFCWVLSFKKLD